MTKAIWNRLLLTVPLVLLLLLTQFYYANEKQPDKDKQSKKPAATQTQKKGETQTQTEEAIVSYDVLLEGTYSGLNQPLTRVVQNQKEWLELWKKHTALLVPQPPAPTVDFDASVVAVIASGEKRTSGYRIVIKHVEFQGQDIVIQYLETQPPANSMTLQVTTQPFMMLRLQKPSAGGTVRLVKV